MARKTLIVLESPWAHGDGADAVVAEYSMRPFVEGLCELHNWNLLYRTFTSARELSRLMEREACDDKADRQIVYIACHGSAGRLNAGIFDPEDINLGPLADKLFSVEGIWLGACDIGASNSMDRFLRNGGAFWAGGYCCSVDWDSCMLIDIAVLNTFMSRRAVTSRSGALDTFDKAFERFIPWWTIGVDANDEEAELGESLRLWARDQGGRPEDLTPKLISKLGWDSIEEQDAG